MNIEEAKANIGKEVVYIGSKELAISDFKDGVFLIKEVSNGYIHTRSDKINWVLHPHDIELKHPTFKAGDQVVLDESTKPYTLTERNGSTSKREGELDASQVYVVIGTDDVGDVELDDEGFIHPRHLKLAPQQEAELPEFKVGEVQPSINQYLKDVTDLLQSLDVSFVVKEDDLAFTVVYAGSEERISKSCVRSLSWAYGLVIAEEAGKESEFIEMYGKLVECSTLLRKAGHEVKTTMRGIEVL